MLLAFLLSYISNYITVIVNFFFKYTFCPLNLYGRHILVKILKISPDSCNEISVISVTVVVIFVLMP
jgi:hypothetical protein